MREWFIFRSGRVFINTKCGFYSHYTQENVIGFLFPLRCEKGHNIFEEKYVSAKKYANMIASKRIVPTTVDEEHLFDRQLKLF